MKRRIFNKFNLFRFASTSIIFFVCHEIGIAETNEPPSQIELPNGQVICDLTMNQVGNTCIRKTFEELEDTIRQLTARYGADVCDDFGKSCKSGCVEASCHTSCDEGVMKCKSGLVVACDAGEEACSSDCTHETTIEFVMCTSSCTSGADACKK